MTTAAPPITDQQKPWAKAIAQPAHEFPLTPLVVLEGEIPADLRGSLYRNGPGRLERQGQRVSHWFDGDGAVLAVHFAGGTAQATYRYVRSAGFTDEEDADQFLYSGYGSLAPGPFGSAGVPNSKMPGTRRCWRFPISCLPCGKGGGPIISTPKRWKRRAFTRWANSATMSLIRLIPNAILRPGTFSTLGWWRGPMQR